VAVAIPAPDVSDQWMAISATLLAPSATDALLDEIAAELHVVADTISVGLGRPVELERPTA